MVALVPIKAFLLIISNGAWEIKEIFKLHFHLLWKPFFNLLQCPFMLCALILQLFHWQSVEQLDNSKPRAVTYASINGMRGTNFEVGLLQQNKD